MNDKTPYYYTNISLIPYKILSETKAIVMNFCFVSFVSVLLLKFCHKSFYQSVDVLLYFMGLSILNDKLY